MQKEENVCCTKTNDNEVNYVQKPKHNFDCTMRSVDQQKNTCYTQQSAPMAILDSKNTIGKPSQFRQPYVYFVHGSVCVSCYSRGVSSE